MGRLLNCPLRGDGGAPAGPDPGRHASRSPGAPERMTSGGWNHPGLLGAGPGTVQLGSAGSSPGRTNCTVARHPDELARPTRATSYAAVAGGTGTHDVRREGPGPPAVVVPGLQFPQVSHHDPGGVEPPGGARNCAAGNAWPSPGRTNCTVARHPGEPARPSRGTSYAAVASTTGTHDVRRGRARVRRSRGAGPRCRPTGRATRRPSSRPRRRASRARPGRARRGWTPRGTRRRPATTTAPGRRAGGHA